VRDFRLAYAGNLSDEHSRDVRGDPLDRALSPGREHPRAVVPGGVGPVAFAAQPEPSDSLCAEVSALAPANPFYTAAYLESRRALGHQPWMLCLSERARIRTACSAFMWAGRLHRTLEIPSLPPVDASERFWPELLEFCRRSRVSRLTVNSFGSSGVAIPPLPTKLSHRPRCEYVLDLVAGDLRGGLAMNHRRNINRARRAGLRTERAANPAACEEHARLIGASMRRRQERGEAVAVDPDWRSWLAMGRAGAGEIFQAVLDRRVLSSVFVLRAKTGAYYQSAGTSPEGMAAGASHFLVYEIARVLRAESLSVFNIGGADSSNPGLLRFKRGFGAAPVPLEAAEFWLGSTSRARLMSAVSALGRAARLSLERRGRGSVRQRR
jgi:hypothetical protein